MVIRIILMALILGFSSAVYAEGAFPKDDLSLETASESEMRSAKDRWKTMSEDERAAFKKEMRERYTSLSPEEKQKLLEKRKARKTERREEWKNMSEEERAAKKAEMKQKRETLSPEQKEKAKAHREERKEYRKERKEQLKKEWETLSPEEKAKRREEMKGEIQERRKNRIRTDEQGSLEVIPYGKDFEHLSDAEKPVAMGDDVAARGLGMDLNQHKHMMQERVERTRNREIGY